MPNPMENLPVIGIPSFERDFYWELFYYIGGGFIGLKDFKYEYNVYSTGVKYDLDELIQDAERVNKKILSNIDKFKTYIDTMTLQLGIYKDTEFLVDFNTFENTTKELESWLNE